jgi:hypothetical protein
MEKTFAGMVAEVERVIRPLGFRIEYADRKGKIPLISGQVGDAGDDSELKITIVRKGKLG